VGDAKQEALGTDSDPICYVPHRQLPWGIGTVVLRTTVPPSEVLSAARAELFGLDPQVPMSLVRTGEEITAAVRAPVRFMTVLMASFAAVALLLTVVGLYGVLSYMVARRRREIGLRMALGARRGEVIGIVGRRAAVLVALGLALGSVAALGVARLVGNGPFGLSAGIPMAVAGACFVMALSGALATFIPAARAASVDPVQTLRSE
jgi:ABC-type antimicrobial peptide transport system permease subunit